MRHSITSLFAVAALALGSTAYSATVELEGTTAVAVNNLDVNGTLYNVAFGLGVWPDVLTAADFVFDMDVFDAANALNAALTAAAANSTGEPGGSQDLGIYGIPVYQLGGNVLWLGGAYVNRAESPGWTSDIAETAFSGSAPTDFPLSWAKFSVVPVPAAVWLFGSALGLLGWMKRKAA